ncbi:helix-turn-helix domain-containing protein, partial [Pediococcus pentosaceus]
NSKDLRSITNMKNNINGAAFKKRLYEYMNTQNLTLNRAATPSGITPSTLNNIVNRESAPRLDTMLKICNGLNISVRDFLNFPTYNKVGI